jgi:GNAT superfamily N-acetyltransferase
VATVLSSVRRPRTLEPGEEPKLTALFEAVYGSGWRAKTTTHRYLGSTIWPATVSVVEMGSLIVGAQPSYDVPLSVRGARRMCTILADVVTHPQYRRRGIFASVVDHATQLSQQRGASLALTTPNNASYPGFRKKPDWRLLARLPCWIRLLRPRLILERGLHLPRWLSQMLDPSLLWLAHGALRAPTGTMQVSQLPSAASLDDLWHRSAPAAAVIQCRDSVWVRWRFGAAGYDNPYRFFTDYASDGRLVGYIVVRLKSIRGILAAFLVDGFWPEAADHVSAPLMDAACAWACEEGAAVIVTYASPSRDWSNALSRATFRRLPQAVSMRPYHVCVRIHPGDPEQTLGEQTLLKDSTAWRLTLADSDLI